MEDRELERARGLLEALSSDLNGSFELLVLTHQDRLYSFALRLSGNSQDAEEIAQDAFVRAYRALRGYDAERIHALALRPWLYQIALNVFCNRARRLRVDTVSIGGDGEDETRPELADDAQRRPEAALARAERDQELAALLAGLPQRYRAAVILRFVEGLSYAELAAVLGQPPGTVKANVHRGIEWLRRATSVSGNGLGGDDG